MTITPTTIRCVRIDQLEPPTFAKLLIREASEADLFTWGDANFTLVDLPTMTSLVHRLQEFMGTSATDDEERDAYFDLCYFLERCPPNMLFAFPG